MVVCSSSIIMMVQDPLTKVQQLSQTKDNGGWIGCWLEDKQQINSLAQQHQQQLRQRQQFRQEQNREQHREARAEMTPEQLENVENKFENNIVKLVLLRVYK